MWPWRGSFNSLGLRVSNATDGILHIDNTPRVHADVVNLGYVINVIEDTTERCNTLRQAWDLCRNVLIVSAQILIAGRGSQQVEFGDGVLTRRGTFQKYFTQGELREYIETVSGDRGNPGRFRCVLCLSKRGSSATVFGKSLPTPIHGPRQRLSEIQFAEHKQS